MKIEKIAGLLGKAAVGAVAGGVIAPVAGVGILGGAGGMAVARLAAAGVGAAAENVKAAKEKKKSEERFNLKMDTFRQGSKYILKMLNGLDEDAFNSLICALRGEEIPGFESQDEAITISSCTLKLATYFEYVTENTGLTFEKQFESYTKMLDTIVARRIIGLASKKSNSTEKRTRASLYYNKAKDLLEKQGEEGLDIDAISSYSRIMFCLYMAIIENNYRSISTFNYSASCLDLEKIISSMRTETGNKGKLLFDMSSMYGKDRCAAIISMLFLSMITNNRLQGEYFNG